MNAGSTAVSKKKVLAPRKWTAPGRDNKETSKSGDTCFKEISELLGWGKTMIFREQVKVIL